MFVSQGLFVFVFLFVAGLGFFVLSRDASNCVNKRFCIFTLALSVWIILIFLTISTVDQRSAVFRLRLVYCAALFVPFAFFFFTSVFPDTIELPAHRYLSRLFFIISVVMSFFSSYIVDSVSFENSRPHARYGFLFPVFWLYFIPCMSYSLYSLYRKGQHYYGIKRLQVQYLFLGVFVFLSIGILTNFILPVVGIWQAEMFAPLVAIPIPTAVTYAIVRYHLMDISVVIKRSTAYALLSLIISAIYFIVGLIMGKALPVSDYKDTLTALISIAIIGLFFISVRESIQHFVEKMLFRTRYSHPKILSDSTAIFSSVYDVNGLFRHAIQYLYDSVGIEKICILIKNEENKQYAVGAEKYFPAGNGLILPAQNEIVLWLCRNKTVLSRDQLSRFSRNAFDDALESTLVSLGVDSCIPIFQKGELFGIILLGRKINKKIYTQEDIQMFLAFSGQLAMAAHNAFLYSGLKEAKTYRDNIIQSLKNGVIVIDNSGEVTLVNNEAKRILGLKGLCPTEKILNGLGRNVCQMFMRTLKTDVEHHNIETIIEGERGRVPCGITITKLRTNDGEELGALMILTDLTEIKLLQVEKQHADHLAQLGTLAANIAHEIKNPLVAINTYFQLLPHKKNDEEFKTDFYQIALKEIDRINRIIEDLLNLAKPAKSFMQHIDPHCVIMDTINLFKGVAVEKEIEVATFLEEKKCRLIADEDKLKQMLINILQNSFDALPRKGRIEISTTLMDNFSEFRKMSRMRPNAVFFSFSGSLLESSSGRQCFVMKVSDNGSGIPPDRVSHIFEPFVTSKEKGTGLGLAVVYRIVSDHEGGIYVESRENAGTDFYVSLPVNQTDTAGSTNAGRKL